MEVFVKLHIGDKLIFHSPFVAMGGKWCEVTSPILEPLNYFGLILCSFLKFGQPILVRVLMLNF